MFSFVCPHRCDQLRRALCGGPGRTPRRHGWRARPRGGACDQRTDADM